MRYSRQHDLVSQSAIHNATVMVAGVGGLGGFAALYLAQAGIGTLVIVDHDTVEESNLNRQVLYTTQDIGKKKVEVASKKLKEINPEVNILAISKKINAEFTIPDDVMIVVDGLDNAESRMALLALSEKSDIPYVFGAVEGFMGMVSFVHGNWKKISKLISKAPKTPPQVLGATAGMIAAMQVLEVIKYVSSKGDLLKDRILIYDALSTNFEEVRL